MSRFTFKKLLLIIALALVPMTFYGQENNAEKPKNNNHWFIGIEGGVTSLFADNQSYNLDRTNWNASMSIGYSFAKFLKAYGKIGYFELLGVYDNYYNLDECNFINGNLNVGLDVMQLIKYKPDRVFGFGPHIGYGQLQLRSKSTFNDGTVVKWGYDEEDGNKGGGISGRRVIYEIPMGVDFTFNLSKRFALYADFTAVKTDTECLDANPSGDHKDWYAYANLGLKFKFGYKKDKAQPEPKEVIEEPVEETPVKEEPIEEEPVEELEPEEEVIAEEEAVAVVFGANDIRLTFPVGKSTITRTQANFDEVDKIGADIDNGRVITSIVVIGYASPEGGAKLNENLARERAKSTIAFIKERLGEKARGIKFEAETMGADWEGFYAAVEKSNLSNKDAIIRELKNSSDPIMTLNKLATLYPSIKSLYGNLRRTEIIIKD